jgi:ribosomal protein S9
MENNLTLEEKIYGLSLLWKEAEYVFAFWDNLKELDWNKAYAEALHNVIKTNDTREYYLELMKFISLLRDGHTGISTFPHGMLETYGTLPLEVRYIENKHIILNAEKNLENEIFNEIHKINGLPIRQYIEEKIFPYIWHEKFDSAHWRVFNFLPVIEAGNEITIETSGGIFKVKPSTEKIQWVKKYSLTSNENFAQVFKSDTLKVSVTNDNLAVIAIPTFMDNELPAQFDSILPQIKDCKGFLIDVRCNGGGNSSNADSIAQAFINGSFEYSRHRIPVIKGVYKAWGTQYRTMEDETFSTQMPECPVFINSPVVILENADTASAAENFLVDFDNINRATIVGTPSYGSTGQPLSIDIPGGGKICICTRWCLYPNGKEFINTGVIPHIYAGLSLNDYKNNFDSVFEKGMAVLRDKAG